MIVQRIVHIGFSQWGKYLFGYAELYQVGIRDN